MGAVLGLTLGLWPQAAAAADPGSLVRVAVLDHQAFTALRLKEPGGPWHELRAQGATLLLDGRACNQALFGGGGGLRVSAGAWSRDYPGTLTVRAQAGRLQARLALTWRDYVAGVVDAEAGAARPPEFLRALAWVARAFALRAHVRHPGADVCDLTHCQAYHGRPLACPDCFAAADWALAQTRPIPAQPLFTGSCGGLLDDPASVWGGAPAGPGYPKACVWQGQALCGDDPDYRWTRRVDREQMALAFADLGRRPAGARLLAWGPLKRSPAGRALSFEARWALPDGHGSTAHCGAAALNSAVGKRYGWRLWPSLSFSVTPAGNADLLEGRGNGHGAGLCLAGAQTLAKRGLSAGQILDFYFGASLDGNGAGRVPSPPLAGP